MWFWKRFRVCRAADGIDVVTGHGIDIGCVHRCDGDPSARSWRAQWNATKRLVNTVCWGVWNQFVSVTGTFFWIKRVWFACLLPHLLLLLTSQIHFSQSSLSSSPPLSTTVSRISRCFIFYTYLVVPSLARGFYIYLLIVFQILFSFLSFNHRNRSKCLIYWLASPYRIKYSLSDYAT